MERVILKKLFQRYSNIFWRDLRTYGVFVLPLPLFLYLSATNFISHSEFWSIASATIFGSTLHEALVLNLRPVFYLFLKIPYLFNLQNTNHIIFARLQFGFLAFLNLLLTYRLIRALQWSRSNSLFFCTFLFSFHVYFYNAYRVRSDFLTLFFVLIIIERLVRPRLKLIAKFKFDPMIPLLVFCLSLATPKSIYSIIWICSLYAFLNFDPKKPVQIITHITLFFILPAGTLVLGMQIVGIGSQFIDNIYALAFNYYYNALANIWSYENFNAVFRSLRINFIQYFCILIGSFLFLLKRKALTKSHQVTFLLFTLSLVTLLIHPERWDYFIASILPFLALPFLFILSSLKNPWQKFVLLIFLFLLPLHMTYFKGWWFSNKGQFKNVEQVALIMDHFPDARLFDSTGVAPRAHNFLWYLGPYDLAGNRRTVKLVEATMPEFILYTPKLRFGGPELIIILNKYYEEVRPNLWVNNQFSAEFNSVHFPQWNYNLGVPFVYDRIPKIRSLSPSAKENKDNILRK